jgi:ankyrin repeat protein
MKNLIKIACLIVAIFAIAFQQAFSQDIYSAVADGNVEMVRQFLEKDPGLLNLKNPDLLTPLNLAAERGQFAVAVLLLKMGADPTIGDNENSQPIHLAAVSGSIPVLDLLLKKGVDINTKDINQMTPLLFAVSRGKLEMTKHLIELGADVNHKDKDGFCALHNVAGRGNIDIAKLLIDSGADVNCSTSSGIVPLTHATWANNATEMGKFLILNGANVNPDPCRNNKACTCGPNFNTPLHAACNVGKSDLIEILVSNGAKVNIFNSNGLTPLHNAVNSGNLDAVRTLLDHGAFLNVQEREQGCTELHLAAAMGYGDITKLLMEKGACPKMMNNDGKTPFDLAFLYGQKEIGYDMLASGADDSKLSDYLNSECLLTSSLTAGDAVVWYLGGSGWAIKTQNHFLVFDYVEDPRAEKPDNPCLASGCIDTAEIKNQRITVFSTHGHADHFNNSIFNWKNSNQEINYVLCFNPVGITDDYIYIPPNGEAEVDGMKIYVNKSTDSGGGYLIETDGLVIFHMGDHANGENALSPAYTKEIDLIAEKNKKIDILFGPIRGCSLGTPDQVKAGTYYTLEKLHPALFVPMHAGIYPYGFRSFVEQAREDGITSSMKYAIFKGDRFRYSKGEATSESTSGLPASGLN